MEARVPVRMSKIIILSTDADAHLSYVTRHLKDEEVVLINPADMLDGVDTIDYHFAKGKVEVFYKDELLADVKSVWVRRPTLMISRPMPVKSRHVAYVRNAANRHLDMFNFIFPDALWMSDVNATRVADIKIVQLQLAEKVGFNIPETLFSSTPRRAKAFVQQQGICIAKTMTHIMPYKSLAFTKILKKTDSIDYSHLYLDPYTFQEYIKPAYELRITVVGDQVFAAKVDGEEIDGTNSKFRDWRYAHANNTFKASIADIPDNIAEKCIRFVKEIGLLFGAFDFIVDENGKYWFLEINPGGQWAFIEQATGQPIGKAIAKLLKNGK
jgi:glutathione synthase/RimK-type ligase-like ATP-grasp enzyme